LQQGVPQASEYTRRQLFLEAAEAVHRVSSFTTLMHVLDSVYEVG
jgi:hypothetical protein